MTEAERREWRQMMGRLADELDAVERLVMKLAMTEARIAAIEQQQTRDRVLIDQLVAWAHGSEAMPELTPGAQAVQAMGSATRDRG